MEITDEQIQSLAKFALKVLEEWPGMGSLDGGDLQEIAVANNILIPHIVHGPCCEECFCNEFYDDEEWREGVTCYRLAEWLDRVAEQRNEAEAPIRGADNFIHSANYETCQHPDCVAERNPPHS